MKDTIYKLIVEKAQRKLSTLTTSKASSYVSMCYAGLRSEIDKVNIIDIAEELGYTASGVSKLVTKWHILRTEGDVTANLITAAYIKMKKGGRTRKPKEEAPAPSLDTPTKEDVEKIIKSEVTAKKKSKGYKFKIVNLELSEAEVMRERACIREAIKFMEEFGKGREPRRDGEYFAPGTAPHDNKDKGKWLAQEAAAMYCGCSVETLAKAANQDLVERRVYLRNTRRNYYEYLISSLDDFISKFGME